MYMLLVYIRDSETSYSKPTNIQFLERQGKSLIIHVQNYFLLGFSFFSLYYFLLKLQQVYVANVPDSCIYEVLTFVVFSLCF